MTLGSEMRTKLMAYADGELSADEQAEVEALVSRDEEAARFVAGLGLLGDAIRGAYQERSAAKIEGFDVADAVMARLAASSSPPAANVIPIGERRSRAWSIGERRSRAWSIGAAVVAVCSAAAAVALYARGPEEAPLATAQPAAVPTNAVEPASEHTGVEVEAVESAEHTVSVFYLPAANELSTSVVVWVEEKGEN